MLPEISPRQKLMKALRDGDIEGASGILFAVENGHDEWEPGQFFNITADIAKRYPEYAKIIGDAVARAEVGYKWKK